MESELAVESTGSAAAANDDAAGPLFAQLEAYARDVRLLHGQRATLAEEVRAVERKLAAADHKQAALYARLEQEHERTNALVAARQSVGMAAGRAPPTARTDSSVLVGGLVGGVLMTLVVAAIALMLGWSLDLLPGTRAAAAPADGPVLSSAGPTPMAPAPVVVSSTQALPTVTPGATPSAQAVVPIVRATEPATPGPATPAAAPARCASDMVVPPLAPRVAYVLQIKQERPDLVTVLWPAARGKIALAAAGPLPPGIVTPAIIPLFQVPHQILEGATSGVELSATVPPGQVFAVLVNDSSERLAQSRAVLLYAGGAVCA